jgi:hypothetical protein
MTTATKTASHYVVMGYDATAEATITLDVSESLQGAVEYRDLHNLKDNAEVWVIFTDASSERVA